MVLLFDENISYRIVKRTKHLFPESIHVTDVRPSIRGDMNIFNHAKKISGAIITYDEDYRDIQLLRGFPPKIIWLRFGKYFYAKYHQSAN